MDEEVGVERIALRELQMRRDDQRARVVLAKQQDRRRRDNSQSVHFLAVRIAAFSDLLEDAAARRHVQRQPIKSSVDGELGVRRVSRTYSENAAFGSVKSVGEHHSHRVVVQPIQAIHAMRNRWEFHRRFGGFRDRGSFR